MDTATFIIEFASSVAVSPMTTVKMHNREAVKDFFLKAELGLNRDDKTSMSLIVIPGLGWLI